MDSSAIGERLRYEREKQGLTIEEAAQQLHLPTAVVRALEENRREDLPEAVYVQGYIRNYSRLLGIKFSVTQPRRHDRDELDTPDNFAVLRDEHTHHLVRVWGTWAVSAVVLMLVVMWWMEQHQDPKPAPGRTDEPAATAEPGLQMDPLDPGMIEEITNQQIEADVADYTDEPAEYSYEDFIKPEQTDAKETDVQQVAATPTGTAAEYIERSNTEQAETTPAATEEKDAERIDTERAETTPTGTEKESAGQTGTEATDSSEQAEKTDKEVPLPGNLASLRITSSDRCWTRITDSEDKVMINRTIPAGYERTVFGLPPFDVRLGYAPGVRIWLNGKEHDVKPYISRRQTAFFELPRRDGQ